MTTWADMQDIACGKNTVFFHMKGEDVRFSFRDKFFFFIIPFQHNGVWFSEDTSITMKRIGVSFVFYYNWKYRTTGHLFQDRFRSENVETAKYLLTVVRYIHQNPVKANMVKKEDKWSSCLGYYGNNSYPRGLLDQNYILKIFSQETLIAIKRFIVFNERQNNDKCIEDTSDEKIRLTDEEAR